jgi:hypothetical protein
MATRSRDNKSKKQERYRKHIGSRTPKSSKSNTPVPVPSGLSSDQQPPQSKPVETLQVASEQQEETVKEVVPPKETVKEAAPKSPERPALVETTAPSLPSHMTTTTMATTTTAAAAAAATATAATTATTTTTTTTESRSMSPKNATSVPRRNVQKLREGSPGRRRANLIQKFSQRQATLIKSPPSASTSTPDPETEEEDLLLEDAQPEVVLELPPKAKSKATTTTSASTQDDETKMTTEQQRELMRLHFAEQEALAAADANDNDNANANDDEDDDVGDPPLEELPSEATFDMRSIHDYPPAPTENEPADPSWDTSKVVFEDQATATTKTSPSKTIKDCLDMFETGSWAVASAAFSEPSHDVLHGDIEQVANRLMEEQEQQEQHQQRQRQERESREDEKKEKEQSPDENEATPSAYESQSPDENEATPSAYESQIPDENEATPSAYESQSPAENEATPSAYESQSPDENEATPSAHESLAAVQENAPMDPFDISNPVFEQEAPTPKSNKQDGVDVFDTSSWVQGGAFSDVSISKLGQYTDIDAEYLRLVKEEEEEEEQGGLTEEQKAVAENVKQRMVEAESDAFPDSAIADVEELAPDKAEEEKENKADPDNEPLLVRSSSDDDEDYAASETNDTALSMEERVQLYTTPKADLDDSSTPDEDEVSQDDSKSDEEDEAEEEIAYVERGSDDEDDDDEDDEEDNDAYFAADQPHQNMIGANDAPTFDAAALAAAGSRRRMIEVEGLHLVNDDSVTAPASTTRTADSSVMENSLASSLAGERLFASGSVASVTTTGTQSVGGKPGVLMVPPPPPPSSEKKKKRRSKGDTNDIPRIPPPPEEKMKKWEDGKMRAQKHLDALKMAKSQDTEGNLGEEVVPATSPIETARARAIQIALERASVDLVISEDSTGYEGDDVHGPPEVTRKALGDDFAPNQSGLFASPNKQKQLKSGDKPKSPSTPKIIDQKMAERVAKASSAAAVKFELHFVKGSPSPRMTTSTSPPSNPSQSSSQGLGAVSPIVLCGPDNIRENFLSATTSGVEEEENDILASASGPVGSTSSNGGAGDMHHDTGLELVGGAFSPFKYSDFKSSPTIGGPFGLAKAASQEIETVSAAECLAWFTKEVLKVDLKMLDSHEPDSQQRASELGRLLLEDDRNFNTMCQFVADTVNRVTLEMGNVTSFDELTTASTTDEESLTNTLTTAESNLEFDLDGLRPRLKPMVLTKESWKLTPTLLAANFVSFIFLASKLAQVPSPFGDKNPFLLEIVNLSLQKAEKNTSQKGVEVSSSSVQQAVFQHPQGSADTIIGFVHQVSRACDAQIEKNNAMAAEDEVELEIEGGGIATSFACSTAETPKAGRKSRSRLLIVPDEHPSPFESSVWNAPNIVAVVLSFLGDPVAVCRMKMLNRFCCRIVSENEQTFMRDAVRAGGLSMNVRPAFWMWITLQKCEQDTGTKSEGNNVDTDNELVELEQRGQEGKWHHVIQRDVARSFGNMPPHKTGARLRTDSIVRALVTWGKNRIMKRGVKGGGDAAPTPSIGPRDERQKTKSRPSTTLPPWEGSNDDAEQSEIHEAPTDTVSDWGGVSPVGSFAGSFSEGDGRVRSRSNARQGTCMASEDLALSGNYLSDENKLDLQSKLGFILHSLAAAHGDVGYCQGMDYVVAHLLRILQDTIRWQTMKDTLPDVIKATSSLPDLALLGDETPEKIYEEIDKSLVVEETVFRMMDTMFTTYNLRHMYWPELRCLKTCCRVFEKLIQIKLPVLADHFEHHELNVGLFALGWFQTLFLYLPSMPSATVCHMWDIWLVERSFKIFFRVGTAILFLSQPILLNHELEGMMTYLNTIPDATLLNPDILIACALNIKVTNSMLAEIEAEVTGE